MIAPENGWSFRHVVWATLIFVFVALSFWLIFRFGQVLLILFVAIFIGTVLRPAVAWFFSRGFTRTGAIILIYILIFALISGFFLVLFPLIAEQSGRIIVSLPEYYQKFREGVVYYPNEFISRLGLFLPSSLPVFKPTQQSSQEALASAEQVLGYVNSVIKGFFIAIITLLMSFHWTINGARIIQSFTLMFPNTQRERIRELITAIETKVGAFITGQSLLCLAIGVMALIAYLIIGLPNALVLALIAGVLEAVPVVGPALGAVPASLIALSIAPSKLVWVILATIIIQASENYLLVPRIMRRAVGVNPFVSLLALFAFSSLFGLIGALMAIPIAAIIQLLLETFVFNINVKEPEALFGRDYISRLRYEAKELIHDLRKQTRHKRGKTDLGVKQVDLLIDEIEAITTDLDSALAQENNLGGS